ncbi:hypothetical protein [Candidatus Nitrotoga sp. HW29]|uniref:hypothetical protein n=1 Tax=Candidatus Nitrotoga sp. HW29 TaxID=2886963 RepID=UPI001EF1ED0C|nr:hypothetical protein [Candidatus Nitrotoga sp. HW29]
MPNIGSFPVRIYAVRHRQQRPSTICSANIHVQAAFAASGSTDGSRRLQNQLDNKACRSGVTTCAT